jgi:hypothetical protein
VDQGLAHQMTYGDGNGQTVTHYYAGVKKKPRKKKKKPRKKKKKASSCGCSMKKKSVKCQGGCGS